MESDREFSEGLVGWGLVALVVALLGMAMTQTGCVRRFALYDDGAVLPLDFFNGFDVHGGMNGVDTVDNRRTTLPKPAPTLKRIKREVLPVDPE